MSKVGLGLEVTDLLEKDLFVRFTKGLFTGVLETVLEGLVRGVATEFLVIALRFFLGSLETGFLMTGPPVFSAEKLNVLGAVWAPPKLRFILAVEVTEGTNLGSFLAAAAVGFLDLH